MSLLELRPMIAEYLLELVFLDVRFWGIFQDLDLGHSSCGFCTVIRGTRNENVKYHLIISVERMTAQTKAPAEPVKFIMGEIFYENIFNSSIN